MIDPSQMPDETRPAADPEPPANPWQPYEQAGFDPTRYQPDDVKNGAEFWNALKSRDYRDAALSSVLRSDPRFQDVDLNQLAEAWQSRQQEPDPWDQMAPAEPEGPAYYDPQTGEPVYPGQEQPQYGQQFDPRQLREPVESIIDKRLSEQQRQFEERLRQQEVEREFLGEMKRVQAEKEYDEFETQAVSAAAVQLRQQDPYLTTEEAFKRATRDYDSAINRRFQQMSERQLSPQGGAPGPGPTPSADQPPQSFDEAMQVSKRILR